MKHIGWIGGILLLLACGAKSDLSQTEELPKQLPFFGEPSITMNEVNGVLKTDTLYPEIPPFALISQLGDTITQQTVADKIYVADFFFTTCPTICPIMKSEMLRVYEAFINEPNLVFLSHSIDPEHDSVEVLKAYADRLQVNAQKWYFLTGERDMIFDLAEAYMVNADVVPTAPGGFIHSGAFLLIDQNKHIRGMYDGTVPDEVNRLIREIPILLSEN